MFAGWVQGGENDQIVTLPNGNEIQIIYDGSLHDKKTRQKLPYSVSAEFLKNGSSLSINKQKIIINLPEIRQSSRLFLGDVLDICLHGHCMAQTVFPCFYLGECRDLSEGVVLLNHFVEHKNKYSHATYSESLTPGMRNNFEEAYRRFADEEGKVNIPLLFLFHHELQQLMSGDNELKIDKHGMVLSQVIPKQSLEMSYKNAQTRLSKIVNLVNEWMEAQKDLLSALKRITDGASAQQALANIRKYSKQRSELVKNLNPLMPDKNISVSHLIIFSLYSSWESLFQSVNKELQRIANNNYFGCEALFYEICGKRAIKK